MKGVTGKVLTIVITLVIVVFALIILLVFFNKTIPFITGVVQNIIDGMTNWMCGAVWSKIPYLGTNIAKAICK